MLSRFNDNRRKADHLKLGMLTAFSAGMVNVASVVLFFAFTSNITGHYAVLAEEVSKGNWYQFAVVLFWILLFLCGGFLSNQFIIHARKDQHSISHAIPLLLEVACLVGVGLYGILAYNETLLETEMLVAVLVFAMGLQNGLTASISNFAVKTTHLTGLTTDLAIHLSMLTKARWRARPEVRDRTVLLASIAGAYVAGGIVAGSITHWFQFKVFFTIALVLLFILAYDLARYSIRQEGRQPAAGNADKAGPRIPSFSMLSPARESASAGPN
ncbi:MAG: DUF1275 domain-containing protein [Flavobacteriales bacterium]|nr:DUF1275 domain-containing protein [Flavobacteriales bacterium]